MKNTIFDGKINDALGIAKVQLTTWISTYSGIISEDYLNEMNSDENLKKREEKWVKILSDPDQKVFIAKDTGKVIGFATCGKSHELEGYDSILSSIYILEKYHGKGIGKKLFNKCKMHLQFQECKFMIVWVLTKNPSYKFYEKMGGKYITEKVVEIGKEYVKESAYGWKL